MSISLEQRNCHNASKLNWNKPEHVLIDAVLNAKHFYTPTDKIDSFRACVFLSKCQKSVKICSKYAIFIQPWKYTKLECIFLKKFWCDYDMGFHSMTKRGVWRSFRIFPPKLSPFLIFDILHSMAARWRKNVQI